MADFDFSQYPTNLSRKQRKAWLQEKRAGERAAAPAQVGAGGAERTFYTPKAWQRLCRETLQSHPKRCACCGSRPEHGTPLRVVRIKPAHKYPNLAADPDNVQVLCEDCAQGRPQDDETDWRWRHGGGRK